MDGGGGGGGGSIGLVRGFLSCLRCNAVHTSPQERDADPDDYFRINGGMPFRRVNQLTPVPAPYPTPVHPEHPPAAPDSNEFDEPRDFGPWGDPEELGTRVRRRYVQGLQVNLQRQLEVLVERHQVGALACSVAGPLWVRWVAASKVFDDMLAQKVLAEGDAARRPKRCSAGEEKNQEMHCTWADEEALPRKDRRGLSSSFCTH